MNGRGIQYHRARYYDPSLGVWLSQYPLEVGNRYAYVDGDPVNTVDPSGLIYETPETCSENTPSLRFDCNDWLEDAYDVLVQLGGSNASIC